MPFDLTAERTRIVTGSMQYTISAASIQNPNGVITEPSGSILRAQDGSIWANTDSATAWQNIGPAAFNSLSGTINARIINLSGSVDGHFNALSGTINSAIQSISGSINSTLSGSVDGHFNQLSGTINAKFVSISEHLQSTTKASDTFDRANSTTNLGSTDGANSLDPLTWVQTLGTWGILSNTAYVSAVAAGTQNNFAYVPLSAGMQNMFVQVTLSTLTTTNGTSAGIVIGQDNSNYVTFLCNRSGGGVNKYFIQKNVAGTGATVFSVTDNGVGTPSPATNDVIRLERVQYCIYRAYVNGTFVGACALGDNSTFVSTVRCGLIEVTTGGTTSGARYDSFSAGTIP